MFKEPNEGEVGDFIYYNEDDEAEQAPTALAENFAGAAYKICGIERNEDGRPSRYLCDVTEYEDDTDDLWTIDARALERLDDYDTEFLEKINAGEEIKGWWIDIHQISHITTGKGKAKAKLVCKGYEPPEVDEKSEQFRKDIKFFFNDLAGPWVSPKKNGFEFL